MGLLLSFDFSLGLSKLLLDAFLSWPASRTQEVYLGVYLSPLVLIVAG
jgi:hypothetical protein